jgi:hypothetical protein
MYSRLSVPNSRIRFSATTPIPHRPADTAATQRANAPSLTGTSSTMTAVLCSIGVPRWRSSNIAVGAMASGSSGSVQARQSAE